MLQLPSGQWTNTLEEAYEHLLQVHFQGVKLLGIEIVTQQIHLRLDLYIDGSHPQTGIQLTRLLRMISLGGPSSPWSPINLLGLMVYTPFYYNGGLNISVLHRYTFTEHLLLWDIYLEYGDLLGLPLFPRWEALLCCC